MEPLSKAELDKINERFFNTIKSDYSNIDPSEIANKFVDLYMNKKKIVFSSRFSFDGDPFFTKRMQKIFFNIYFRYGRVAIKKYEKGGTKDKVIVIPNIFSYNHQGDPLKATYNDIPFHINYKILDRKLKEKTTNKIDNKNAAFLFNHIFYDGYLNQKNKIESITGLLWNLVYQYFIAIKLKIDKIIINKTSGNSKIGEKLINTKGVSAKITSDGEGVENFFSGKDDSQSKIVRFNISLREFNEAIDNFIKIANVLLGDRSQVEFKKERKITSEVQMDLSEFLIAEKHQFDKLDEFVENYNKIFNTTIEVVDNLKADLENQEQPNNQGENNGYQT